MSNEILRCSRALFSEKMAERNTGITQVSIVYRRDRQRAELRVRRTPSASNSEGMRRGKEAASEIWVRRSDAWHRLYLLQTANDARRDEKNDFTLRFAIIACE